MASLRIAVTGGSGLVGRAVVRCLVGRGHQVVNLDCKQSPDRLARFVFADLRRREQVQPVFEHVDAVCHLGEIPSLMNLTPEYVFTHNTAAGSVVMQTAADLGIKRLIYTSSIQYYGIYGDQTAVPLFLPMDESHPPQPQQAYALSKVANEQYAQLVSRLSGMSIAIFRLPWTHDWSHLSHPDHDPAWFAKPTPNLFELGAYLHVDDAAEAYALAVERPRPGCEAYNLVAAEACTNRPVREVFAERHPNYPALPTDWPAFRSPYVADKIRAHFGWEPRWNVRERHRPR